MIINMDRTPIQHKRPIREDALGHTPSGRKTMRKTLTIAIISTTALATPALAKEVEVKPLIDARLRYEHDNQKDIPVKSDAVTLRIRAGVTAKKGAFAILVEGEGTLAISGKYNSGLNGKPGPVIGDPENIELNRAQIQFTAIPQTIITAGRQVINLDDQRFVSAAAWRQNEQTFDAVRAEWTGIKGVKADLTYAWGQRTIWGVDGFGARQQAVSGNNILANLSYKGKIFGLTAFTYIADLDEAPVQAFRLSSQTYGARGNINLPLGKAKLNLLASYARQSDYNNNPNNSSADFILGEATLDVSPFKLVAGYEVLGADNGVPLSSFQTPFAALHKFNGTADKFLITPANGLRDMYLSIGASPKIKILPGFNAQLARHQFKSDRLSQKYGTEWDAQMGWKLNKKLSFLAKYADYKRKGTADFAGDADTQKFWAQIDYAF
jgi:Alginate export